MPNWAICTPLHVPLTLQTATPESFGAPIRMTMLN